MTACVNKKHSRRVAAAVSASLVGALTLGAAPAVVMAAEAPVETQFADPVGWFEGAEFKATFKHAGQSDFTMDSRVDGSVASTTYAKNKPVVLDSVEVQMGPGREEADFTITASKDDDDFTVAYFKRGVDGLPTGAEITPDDIVFSGEYVAVVEGKPGTTYAGGKLYIPFDINPIVISRVAVNEITPVMYNGEVRDFTFRLYDEGGALISDAVRGIDYDVTYVYSYHDTTEDNVTEVKDAGKYTAVITGLNGNYDGSKATSNPITVEQLDLTSSKVKVQGVVSASEKEPQNTFALFIEGKLFQAGDPIMDELVAHIKEGTTPANWLKNTKYTYQLQKKDADDANIADTPVDFSVFKVAHELTFKYDGQDLGAEMEVVLNKGEKFDLNKVSAFAQDGTVGGHTIDYADGEINYAVYDAATGATKTATDLNTPGVYYVQLWDDGMSNGNNYGGQTFVKVTVWQDALDVDAKAAVMYDTDDDGRKEVVTSISKTYDKSDLLSGNQIEVAVRKADGSPVPSGDYTVSYYNADGIQVKKIVDAGTYTLKVTSGVYKLTGTTEMSITVGKLDMSTVKADTDTMEFDNVGSSVEYLPWRELGYGITEISGKVYGLNLTYLEADGKTWTALPMNMVRVTITDAEGNELQKITDEGVYTISFAARNADAENNYVVPEPITVTVIKDGTDYDGHQSADVANHLKFSDVRWSDYFADPVDWISGKGIMFGYKAGRVFGALDNLSRGQVACVLYNMASVAGRVNETDLVYSELHGYDTGFSDVDGKAYYAKAIAWAAQAGVVNGYADGTFHADQAVTRQEFACMLANYAKAYGTYEAASADALDKMSDADQVAGFAVDSVAWAVENGIIGNSGYVAAGSTIIRADAACMVYNYAK